MIKNTGVTASAEDIAEAIRLATIVRETPVMRVGGVWLCDHAQETFATRIDNLAQKYGLPAPGLLDGRVNHYGMTIEGEFNHYEPDPT